MPIRLSGMNSGLDTDAIVKELVSAYSLKTEKYEKQKTKVEWKQEAWKTLNTKIYGFYTNVSSMRLDGAYNLKKTVVSDSTKATVTAGGESVTGTQKLNVIKTAQAAYLTGAYIGEDVTSKSTLKDLGYTGGETTLKLKTGEGDKVKETEIKISATTTMSDLTEQLSKAGLNANLDTANGRIFLSAKESGAAGNFELVAENADGFQALKELGLVTEKNAAAFNVEEYNTNIETQVAAYKDKYDAWKELNDLETRTEEQNTQMANLRSELDAYGDKFKAIEEGKSVEEVAETLKIATVNEEDLATVIKGQDAEIKLNNVKFTSSSNTFIINGLTIEATGVTGDGEDKAITISTTTDTQGIYDKIKDFLTEYNTLINEITKMYNAESAKDYEPLTDEEREAMSDEQIEKWEGKIKSALLRRDNSLGNIMNAMINSMSQSYEVNGKTLSLGNFGISTLGFLNAAANEQNAYHIDGDEDDENTSGKKDKLMAAIQEDPDQVMGFMKALASNLYSSIDQKMKSTELSSAYKVYNDKELDRELTDIEKLIAKWEEKIAEQEDAYFKKFSQMEVALSKLQSQTNSLSGLLGQ